MPAIRITRSTVVNRTNVRPGDVVQCSDADARLLVAIGKAERVATPTQAVPALLKPRAATRTKEATP